MANRMNFALQLAVAGTLVVAGIFSGRLALNARAPTATQSVSKPQIENAKLDQRQIQSGLAQEVDAWAANADSAQWLGYSVPAVDADHRMCCGDSTGDWNDGKCGPCRLESGNRQSGYDVQRDDSTRGAVRLEGSGNMIVLFRAEGRKIGKIRAVSENCVLDAGGLAVTWLIGAKPAESVRLLQRFVDSRYLDDRDGDHLSRSALMAIAMHGDATADQAFENFTAPDKPESMRREAAFWAGEARGATGLQLLKRMARNDPSSDVRAHVTFALSLSHESGAIDEMIRMAHEDSNGHVRGQALFWLSQKAGNKASVAITGAIEYDPDTEVKKKAVFALSQMPKDDGVPKLIQVAESNRNPEVRKQAMFWLGQSNDPRALDFFEKVLAK